MMRLNLPEFDYKAKSEAGKTYIFDIIRRKYILLTPEEWVRQHFLHFLINHFSYPRALFRIESGHKFNTLQKRSDIIIYDREGKSFLMVECKAPTEKISQKTFDQVATYNQTINARYIAVTNGLKHFCCEVDKGKMNLSFLPDIPVFKE